MVATSINTKASPKAILKKREYPASKQYPYRHAHYRLHDFFHFQTDTGIITDWNEARDTLTTEDFIIGLMEGLEQEVGSAASMVLYKIGEEWGVRDAKFFHHWFTKEYGYGADLSKHNLLYVLEGWWWPFSAQGWGNWEVDMSEQKNGFMFVNIFDSAVARTLGDVGKPVCHIYAGLMAGFFSGLVKKDLSCIEIQCYAMGETYCKFLVGKKDRIDAATFWQNEGASARDIEKRLTDGAYLE
ncbi:MAG: V4R domain-containing protein [Microcystaceae cyanobacterium]